MSKSWIVLALLLTGCAKQIALPVYQVDSVQVGALKAEVRDGYVVVTHPRCAVPMSLKEEIRLNFNQCPKLTEIEQ